MENFLQSTDYVGVSFWLVSVAMSLQQYFFYMKECTLNLHGAFQC